MEPVPSSEDTRIKPPCRVIISRARYKPIPIPGGVMYAAFTIKTLENRSLMLFWNTNAGIRNINLHIHFPTHNSHMDFPPSGVYFTALSRMLNRASVVHFRSWAAITVFRAIHCDRDFFSVQRSAEYRPAQRQGYHKWPAAVVAKKSRRFPAGKF